MSVSKPLPASFRPRVGQLIEATIHQGNNPCRRVARVSKLIEGHNGQLHVHGHHMTDHGDWSVRPRALHRPWYPVEEAS